MNQGISSQKIVMAAVLTLGTASLLGGCATKKYVKTTVDTTAQGLSARIGENDKGIATNSEQIKASSGQISELNDVARQHGQRISDLDSTTKQAQSAATQAQNSANQAANDVMSLDGKFQNRNHYVVLDQEQVLFKFNSAKLETSFQQSLDDVVRQLHENPDLILVMEGHTDTVGSSDYNFQLGQKRLEAVMRYLVVDKEVPVNRISQMSFGKERPLNPEKSREARAQNRSVVVRVMGPRLTDSDNKSGFVSRANPESEVLLNSE